MFQVLGLDEPFHILDTISHTALCNDTIRGGFCIESYDRTAPDLFGDKEAHAQLMELMISNRHGEGKNPCKICKVKFDYRQHWKECDTCESYEPVCDEGKEIKYRGVRNV